MISNINDANALIVAYESGSSGEFFCSLLAQSFGIFSNEPHNWHTDTRASFVDLFGKELACGKTTIDHASVLRKINGYIKSHNPALRHIGAMHPRPEASVEFINSYASALPMIKIVCYELESKRFRRQAVAEKLQQKKSVDLTKVELPNEMQWAQNLKNHSIEVEWSSLFLYNTKAEFHRIETFIGKFGNWVLFNSLVQDYMHRNREILLKTKIDQ